MLTMLLPDDSCGRARRPNRPVVPFEVGVGLLAFGLCLLYGLLFGCMLYVSLVEQAFAGHEHLSAYGSRPHFHSPAEWALTFLPAAIAWSGTISSARYLARRWQRAR